MSLQGSVVQVNVSSGGIPKRPIPEGHATVHGLDGDRWAHPQFHGGPQQAILIICQEALDDLKAQGFPVFPGAMGENITVEGIDHRQFRIGQRWRIGRAWVELTKIRVPCKTLDVYGKGTIQKAVYDKQVKAGDPTSPLWAKGGIYAAVVTEGLIRAGDPVLLVDQSV
jgi:MOSC domain-containing protein YiiM